MRSDWKARHLADVNSDGSAQRGFIRDALSPGGVADIARCLRSGACFRDSTHSNVEEDEVGRVVPAQSGGE